MPVLPLGNEGKYLGVVTAHQLSENEKTGSLNLGIDVLIKHQWTGEAWEDVSGEGYTVSGFVNLKRTDAGGGAWNDKAIQTLVTVYGWKSGDFSDLEEILSTSEKLLMVSIKDGMAQNNYPARSEINFIDVPVERPGAGRFTPSDPGKVSALTSKYASQLRAMAGSVKTGPVFEPVGAPKDEIPWGGPVSEGPADTAAEDLGGL